MVGWPGEQAELGARRWRLWGGRWDAGFGEQAGRPGQYAGVQAR
jgi:hypothetical protein